MIGWGSDRTRVTRQRGMPERGKRSLKCRRAEKSSESVEENALIILPHRRTRHTKLVARCARRCSPLAASPASPAGLSARRRRMPSSRPLHPPLRARLSLESHSSGRPRPLVPFPRAQTQVCFSGAQRSKGPYGTFSLIF